MTTSTERAKAIVDAMCERHPYFEDDLSFDKEASLVSLIAQAIREAEDAALERVRGIVQSAVVPSDASADFMRRLILAALDERWEKAAAILKSQEPSP